MKFKFEDCVNMPNDPFFRTLYGYVIDYEITQELAEHANRNNIRYLVNIVNAGRYKWFNEEDLELK